MIYLGGWRGRLISALDRKTDIELIEEAKTNGARDTKAYEIFDINVRPLQRWRKEGSESEDRRLHAHAIRQVPSHKLIEEEISVVLDHVATCLTNSAGKRSIMCIKLKMYWVLNVLGFFVKNKKRFILR